MSLAPTEGLYQGGRMAIFHGVDQRGDALGVDSQGIIPPHEA